MLDRAACERRVYRLAVLLTGNPKSAAKVIDQVLDAQPDLRRLDSAHLDRLTVLRSREMTPAVVVDDRVPHTLAAWLAALDSQQREAWIFMRVYQLTDREMSRAMDCSLAAAVRHLEQAERLLHDRLGDLARKAPSIVLNYSMQLDVPASYRIEKRRRHQYRRAWAVISIAVIAAALAILIAWWARPLSAG